ncbi:hypothetical protein BJ170DRAFT_608320 [Xylariales sp. AK1849]|nr:hypothetical protein BJ170DRAFT_608320 [Xylariales sp. AK1849]
MSSTVTEPITVTAADGKTKKSKREKGQHRAKKRNREEGQPEEERKHKRSKSEAITNGDHSVPAPAEPTDMTPDDVPAGELGEEERKREKREKKRREQAQDAEVGQVNRDTAMADVAAGNSISQQRLEDASSKPVGTEKKKKKKKNEKRHQETEAAEVSTEPDAVEAQRDTEPSIEQNEAKVVRKSKKHKKTHEKPVESNGPIPPVAPVKPAEIAELDEHVEEPISVADDTDEAAKVEEKKRRRKEKKEKRRKEKEAQGTGIAAAATTDADALETSPKPTSHDDGDAMDIDVSPTKMSGQIFGKLPDKPFPFFTQRVSQYLPLFPLGMIEPVEGYADQHLKPLVNHYVPTFKGVLLGYHDVEIGEAPGKGSITERSDIADEVVLESIDEYAVGFGWLTAKVNLFQPSRGAWLEGLINLQTEGHLGVVCWGMFNASIEASRLPQGWQWVSLLGKGKEKGKEKTSEEAKLPTPEPVDEGDDDDDVVQLHTSGYWVDEQGQRVRGTLRFQIKNFEVGVSGDYGYLSIEGTMLDEDAERQKVAEEVEKTRRWKLRNGASRKAQKRMPDFAMTKFGMEEEQEDESKRAEIWKGSRPASETAE